MPRLHGPAIVAELRRGFSALPVWMQDVLREMTAIEAPRRGVMPPRECV